ncbi:hypothetical protein ANO14919_097820 [Xylariales sp. No.14919]|nr:hypothetical protein ANO14919_097820 [Xylariales sp. No.14919]
MPSFRSILLSTTTLASLSVAHISLENPKPYKFVGDGRTNPVSSTGSDFPCRIPPGQSYIIDGEPTSMTIGEDQTLSFSGHAVHGGGSCQIALSRGFPTKDSPWMVIHSIEGGCPARNQKGNIDGPNQDKYIFQIPEGIEPGTNWTLAYTWVSRIGGQPEFYMECSPITVLPAKQKRMSFPDRREALSKRHDDFPELFMANMGEISGGCTTSDAQKEQIAVAYPNPGASIERNDANLFKQQCDGNPRAKKAPAGGADDGDNKTPQAGPSTAASASPSGPSSPPGSTAVGSSYDEYNPSTASSAAVTPTTLMTATLSLSDTPSATTLFPFPSTSSAADVPSATTLFPFPTSSVPAQSSASASAPAPCSCSCALPAATTAAAPCTEGELTCLEDGTHFATCTGGKLTAPQPIAPGYKCQPGAGVGLEISPM